MLLGLMRLKQSETVLVRLTPPRCCTDSRLKHIPSLHVKKLKFLVLEAQLVGQVSGLSHKKL